MESDSLEYMVIDMEDDLFTHEIVPWLHALQQSGLIRVVDLAFVGKDTEGTMAVWRVSELSQEERRPYGDLLSNLTSMFTAKDVEQLTEFIPSGTSAVAVLFEHTWTLQLAEAVRRAGGMLFTGSMGRPEALVHTR